MVDVQPGPPRDSNLEYLAIECSLGGRSASPRYRIITQNNDLLEMYPLGLFVPIPAATVVVPLVGDNVYPTLSFQGDLDGRRFEAGQFREDDVFLRCLGDGAGVVRRIGAFR